jgi:hypothetical protein
MKKHRYEIGKQLFFTDKSESTKYVVKSLQKSKIKNELKGYKKVYKFPETRAKT